MQHFRADRFDSICNYPNDQTHLPNAVNASAKNSDTNNKRTCCSAKCN